MPRNGTCLLVQRICDFYRASINDHNLVCVGGTGVAKSTKSLIASLIYTPPLRANRYTLSVANHRQQAWQQAKIAEEVSKQRAKGEGRVWKTDEQERCMLIGDHEYAGGRCWSKIETIIATPEMLGAGHALAAYKVHIWRVISDEAHEKDRKAERLVKELIQRCDLVDAVLAANCNYA